MTVPARFVAANGSDNTKVVSGLPSAKSPINCCHIWRQGEVGKLIAAEVEKSQGRQARRQVEAAQLIVTKAEETQSFHVRGQIRFVS